MKPKQRGVIFKSLIRIIKITPGNFRLRGFVSFMFLFVNSGLDLLGLGAVIPLISVLLEEDAVHKSDLLQWIYTEFGFSSSEEMVVFLSSLILGFILLKNLLSLVIQWYQAKFSYDLQRRFVAVRSGKVSATIFLGADYETLSIDDVVRLGPHASDILNGLSLLAQTQLNATHGHMKLTYTKDKNMRDTLKEPMNCYGIFKESK